MTDGVPVTFGLRWLLHTRKMETNRLFKRERDKIPLLLRHSKKGPLHLFLDTFLEGRLDSREII